MLDNSLTEERRPMKTITLILICILLCSNPVYSVTFEQIEPTQLNSLHRQNNLSREDYLSIYKSMQLKSPSIMENQNTPFDPNHIQWDLSKNLPEPEGLYLLPTPLEIQSIEQLKKLNLLKYTLEDDNRSIKDITQAFEKHLTFKLADTASIQFYDLNIVPTGFSRDCINWISNNQMEYIMTKDTTLYFKRDLVWCLYDLKSPYQINLQGKNILKTLGLHLPKEYTTSVTNHVMFTDQNLHFSLEKKDTLEKLILSENTTSATVLYNDCDPNMIKRTDMDGILCDHIFDLRLKEDYEKSHLENARRITLDDLQTPESFIKSKEDKVLLYCYSDYTSTIAMTHLKNLGYTNVYSLKGGYNP